MLQSFTKKLTGELNLDVYKKAAYSVPQNIYFQGAFKLMQPQYLDNTGQMMYCLLNPGGGYLDGDRYQINIKVHTGADLYLTAQSATKIYKTPCDCVRQTCYLDIQNHGILEYTVDPIIPFQNSSYFQEQEIHLTNSSSLFITDLITPGWSLDGTGFQYNQITLKTTIFYDKSLKVLDSLVLEPKNTSVHSLGLLANFTHYGTIYMIDPHIGNDFEEQFNQYLHTSFSKNEIGLSLLSIPGVAIRILGNSTQSVQDVIDGCQYFFRQHLLGRSNQLFKKY